MKITISQQICDDISDGDFRKIHKLSSSLNQLQLRVYGRTRGDNSEKATIITRCKLLGLNPGIPNITERYLRTDGELFKYQPVLRWRFYVGTIPDFQSICKNRLLKIYRCCQSCGSAVKLEMHHKDGDCTNFEKINLRVLCKQCHQGETNMRSYNDGSTPEQNQELYEVLDAAYVGKKQLVANVWDSNIKKYLKIEATITPQIREAVKSRYQVSRAKICSASLVSGPIDFNEVDISELFVDFANLIDPKKAFDGKSGLLSQLKDPSKAKLYGYSKVKLVGVK